jgi:hypothetical protein
VALRPALAVVVCCTVAALAAACGGGSGGPAPTTTTVTVGASSGSTGSTAPSSPAATPSPVGKVFDPDAMQASVKTILTNDYKVADVAGVKCPVGQQVLDGAKFDCLVTVGGKDEKVTITVTGGDGQYTVSAPE